MLKRYWPTIPLALFLALAVFFEWSSANAPRPINHTASNQQPNDRSVNDNSSVLLTIAAWASDHHDGIEALSAVFSVIFTVALFGSNLLLWGVTRTAANAAKKAADAAEISANAVTVIERAYVYPVVTYHGEISDCIQAALVSMEKNVPASVTAEIHFKFKNFGKTPAILKTAYAGVGAAPLGAKIGLALVESVLGTGEETQTPLISTMQVGITRKQAEHIGAYTGHVCFEGQITFDDIWGNEHTTEFYFVWDHWIGRMNLRWTETKTKQKGEQPEKDA